MIVPSMLLRASQLKDLMEWQNEATKMYKKIARFKYTIKDECTVNLCIQCTVVINTEQP